MRSSSNSSSRQRGLIVGALQSTGQVALQLILGFLEHYDLKQTMSVFLPEVRLDPKVRLAHLIVTIVVVVVVIPVVTPFPQYFANDSA